MYKESVVLIPNTMGVDSANSNVIGQCCPVTQDKVANIAKKYCSYSVTKRSAYWSLKTRWGMLLIKTRWGMSLSNIARKQKISKGLLFFKAWMSIISLTA